MSLKLIKEESLSSLQPADEIKAPGLTEGFIPNQLKIGVGRHPENALCLRSVCISRRHANITFKDGLWYFTDLKPVNRNFINGVAVDSGQTQLLKEGDVLRFGIKLEKIQNKPSDHFTYRFSTEGTCSGKTDAIQTASKHSEAPVHSSSTAGSSNAQPQEIEVGSGQIVSSLLSQPEEQPRIFAVSYSANSNYTNLNSVSVPQSNSLLPLETCTVGNPIEQTDKLLLNSIASTSNALNKPCTSSFIITSTGMISLASTTTCLEPKPDIVNSNSLIGAISTNNVTVSSSSIVGAGTSSLPVSIPILKSTNTGTTHSSYSFSISESDMIQQHIKEGNKVFIVRTTSPSDQQQNAFYLQSTSPVTGPRLSSPQLRPICSTNSLRSAVSFLKNVSPASKPSGSTRISSTASTAEVTKQCFVNPSMTAPQQSRNHSSASRTLATGVTLTLSSRSVPVCATKCHQCKNFTPALAMSTRSATRAAKELNGQSSTGQTCICCKRTSTATKPSLGKTSVCKPFPTESRSASTESRPAKRGTEVVSLSDEEDIPCLSKKLKPNDLDAVGDLLKPEAENKASSADSRDEPQKESPESADTSIQEIASTPAFSKSPLDDDDDVVVVEEREFKPSISAASQSTKQDSTDLKASRDTPAAKENNMEELNRKLLDMQRKHEAELTSLKAEMNSAVSMNQQISDIMESELMCIICNEIFIKPKTLPCSHVFCGYCIDVWLAKKKECPMCRARVIEANPIQILDNYISRTVEAMTEEKRQTRKVLIAERKEEEAKLAAPKPAQPTPTPAQQSNQRLTRYTMADELTAMARELEAADAGYRRMPTRASRRRTTRVFSPVIRSFPAASRNSRREPIPYRATHQNSAANMVQPAANNRTTNIPATNIPPRNNQASNREARNSSTVNNRATTSSAAPTQNATSVSPAHETEADREFQDQAFAERFRRALEDEITDSDRQAARDFIDSDESDVDEFVRASRLSGLLDMAPAVGAETVIDLRDDLTDDESGSENSNESEGEEDIDDEMILYFNGMMPNNDLYHDDDTEYTGVQGGQYEGFGACYNCGDPGHWRPDCPLLN